MGENTLIIFSERSIIKSRASRLCKVLESYIVGSTPSIFSLGLGRRWIWPTVSNSRSKPRKALYWVATGISTQSEAIRALMVRSPREGGQSNKMYSYLFRIFSKASARRYSLWRTPANSSSTAAKSMFAGTRSGPSKFEMTAWEIEILPWSTWYTVWSSVAGSDPT